MLKSFSLKFKLILGFSIVCLGLLLIAGTGFVGLKSVVSEYQQISDISLVKLGHISGLRNRGRQIHAETIKLALYYDNKEESEKTLASLQHALKRYQAIDGEYRQSPFIPGEKEVFDVMDAAWKKVFDQSNEILKIYASGAPDRIEKIKSHLLPFEDSVRIHQEKLLAVDDFHVETGDVWSKSAREIASKSNALLLMIAGVTCLVALSVSVIMAARISRTLNGVAERLKQSADAVAQNSEKSTESSNELSASVTEQAASLQEIVAASTEVSATIQKNMENSQYALSKSKESQRASEDGRSAVSEMLASIDEINDSNQQISRQINESNDELGQMIEMIKNISEKTKVINDIVFQTKLLSFNASVEAARAGVHGKGFSVVAEEVGNLAQMSGKAAQEISSLLESSSRKVEEVIHGTKAKVQDLMEVGTAKIQAGKEKAVRCEDSIEKMMVAMEEVCNMVKDISEASKEQAQGVAEINKALEQMSSVTDQNAASAQNCSNVSENLLDQVNTNHQIVHSLVEVVYGEKKAA